MTPTKGSYVKHDEFEKAACAGSPMFAELKVNWKTSSEWDCNGTRSFNHAVCRAAKPAYAAVPLESYGSGEPCYVVAQGSQLIGGGFGSSDGTLLFWDIMGPEEQQKFIYGKDTKGIKNFQSKKKLLNMFIQVRAQ